MSSSSSILLCKSCNTSGHSSAKISYALFCLMLKSLSMTTFYNTLIINPMNFFKKHTGIHCVDFQLKYADIHHLEDVWTELNNLEGDVKTSVIKKLVYEHVLDQVLLSNPVAVLGDDILTPSIQETKNAQEPLAIILTAPFGILPALRHILSKYESIVAETPISQKRNLEPEKSQDIIQPGGKKEKDDNAKRFVPPKIFSLFPDTGLQWRFIKIDSQNVTSIFPGSYLKKEKDETFFSFTQRYFYDCFNFAKLKIRRSIALELDDFNTEESPEDVVNILLNGSTKYNKKNSKNKKKSKKRRKSKIGDSSRSKPKIIKREHKGKFEEGDRYKMTLIIFGDGLKIRSQTRFKGLRFGVTDKLYRQLKIRKKLGELLLVDVNEF
ncbi:uncharacterized protein EV154DRAFT_481056 [Mucor mucedo]|uniref:uncharacterized protein n=1 Tax=Mucor mucedo TaxID=29922 RepID=UPI002220D606|nr:uncharacterized protein EV154DRAFT_481056 [Mucor mucedo]KAI7891624.1 hypothetical protein EV154DRAFT_481056 [Mucor mucedo]